MMVRYAGLTWDHPRGRDALERAALRSGVPGAPLISWDVHSLEGFESAPIADLAARYDVIVLDHPHLGEALAHEALQPLDGLMGTDWLAELDAACVGPSLASYRMDGHVWALPLDAATQVAVHVSALVEELPATWDDVDALSRRSPVALSLAGPHAYLTFSSLCVALGAEPATMPGEGYADRDAGREAIARMAAIASRAPEGTERLNPIGLLERMRAGRDIAYIPLVYGYSTYAQGPSPLVFDDAPAGPGGRRGSTVGGTGLAVSARRPVGPDLLQHLRWLLEPDTQRRFIPHHNGQPGRREAWTDADVNAAAGGFYRNTLATIEQAWVRPRVNGFIAFQADASRLIRAAVSGQRSADAVLGLIDERFDRIGSSVPERSSS
jgi:multiple sugar transport system substrate-binding protein